MSTSHEPARKTSKKPAATRSLKKTPVPDASEVVGRLVDDGVVTRKVSRGLNGGAEAMKRAIEKEIGSVVRLAQGDVVVLPVRYAQLLGRLVEEKEDRIDIEDADRRLGDPAEIPIPYDQVRSELGFPDTSD